MAVVWIGIWATLTNSKNLLLNVLNIDVDINRCHIRIEETIVTLRSRLKLRVLIELGKDESVDQNMGPKKSANA